MHSLGLSQDQVQQLQRDGLLVVDNFLTSDEINDMKKSCSKLVQDMDPMEHRCVFSTTTHDNAKDVYFLESGDKIRFFFEKHAFDEQSGELTLPKEACLNKIGHALHWLEPAFKAVTFSSKMRAVARTLGLEDPVVIQGMYIFKNPRIGGEVTPHQDGTFLNNDPLKLYGFWFPLDDATLENGCLWYVPGSHRRAVTRRFVRNAKEGGAALMTFRGEDPVIPDDQWVPAPVKKGALVLIHGQVMHKSARNCSPNPRHAFTVHMVETKGCHYSEENWLQPTPDLPFPRLFSST